MQVPKLYLVAGDLLADAYLVSAWYAGTLTVIIDASACLVPGHACLKRPGMDPRTIPLERVRRESF